MSDKIGLKSNSKSKKPPKEKNGANKVSNFAQNHQNNFSKPKSKNINLKMATPIKSEKSNKNNKANKNSSIAPQNNNNYNINNNISININIDMTHNDSMSKRTRSINGIKNRSVGKKNPISIKKDDLKNNSLILRDSKNSKINSIRQPKKKESFNVRIQSANIGIKDFKFKGKKKPNSNKNNFSLTATGFNPKKSENNKSVIEQKNISVEDLIVESKNTTIPINANHTNLKGIKLTKKVGKKRNTFSPTINREMLNKKQNAILNYSVENRKINNKKESVINDIKKNKTIRSKHNLNSSSVEKNKNISIKNKSNSSNSNNSSIANSNNNLSLNNQNKPANNNNKEDKIKDNNKDKIKDNNKDKIKDINKDKIKDINKDSIKDNNKDSIKDDNKDNIKDNNKDNIKDNNKDNSKDNNKDSIKDNNKDNIKDNSNDNKDNNKDKNKDSKANVPNGNEASAKNKFEFKSPNINNKKNMSKFNKEKINEKEEQNSINKRRGSHGLKNIVKPKKEENKIQKAKKEEKPADDKNKKEEEEKKKIKDDTKKKEDEKKKEKEKEEEEKKKKEEEEEENILKEADNRRKMNQSKSQLDISPDFIKKQLEQKIGENNQISPLKSTDREQKRIIRIESICKKGFAGPGVKKTNQDNFFIYKNFTDNPSNVFLGVCDGHGMFGQDVSGYLVNNLPQNLNNCLIKLKITDITNAKFDELSRITSQIFVTTDNNLANDDRVDSTFSGSTCSTLIYTPERLISANVGDSRCVLGKFDGKNWSAKNLTRDHKPNEADENKRIVEAGGRVESYKDEDGEFVGPERVWLKDEEVPGLAMSRSFGDEIAHTVGVISEPEIFDYNFVHEDKFILLGSDGIWEFISSDECVNIVKDYYLKDDIDGALSYLYKESSKRWIMEEEVIDDITLIIIFLN